MPLRGVLRRRGRGRKVVSLTFVNVAPIAPGAGITIVVTPTTLGLRNLEDIKISYAVDNVVYVPGVDPLISNVDPTTPGKREVMRFNPVTGLISEADAYAFNAGVAPVPALALRVTFEAIGS